MSDNTRNRFLEEQLYRRRRFNDAAKFLPLLGAVLFIAPAFLFGMGEGAENPTTRRLGYFFVVWSLLIGCAYFLSWRVSRMRTSEADRDPLE